ncbi:hypothetical protein DFJ73DRAFT_813016 [Zopfochytrium polystomum]|nr:hypothetical protein DFJ73DRAFT_813016 [Zopfochytrium polystomum]
MAPSSTVPSPSSSSSSSPSSSSSSSYPSPHFPSHSFFPSHSQSRSYSPDPHRRTRPSDRDEEDDEGGGLEHLATPPQTEAPPPVWWTRLWPGAGPVESGVPSSFGAVQQPPVAAHHPTPPLTPSRHASFTRSGSDVTGVATLPSSASANVTSVRDKSIHRPFESDPPSSSAPEQVSHSRRQQLHHHNASGSANSHSGRPTTPVSAAWWAMGAWAKGMGKQSVGYIASRSSSIPRALRRRRKIPKDSDALHNPNDAVMTIAKSDVYVSDDDWNDGSVTVFESAVGGDSTSAESESADEESDHIPTAGPKQSGPSLRDMPQEVLLNVMKQVPTSTVASLLGAAEPVAPACVSALTERIHKIATLEDLRAFALDDPDPPPPWDPKPVPHGPAGQDPRRTHTMHSRRTSTRSVRVAAPPKFRTGMGKGRKTQFAILNHLFSLPVSTGNGRRPASIGPLFYRAGTMVLFARHFTRLIPEARALLGVGYAFVLAWFMCLFYFLPFLGALIFYFAMDVVDAFSRSVTYCLHFLSPSIRYLVLPASHPLHPLHPAPPPRVPSGLVRRLVFAAPTPAPAPTEPIRCCGPGGTSWVDDTDPMVEQFELPVTEAGNLNSKVGPHHELTSASAAVTNTDALETPTSAPIHSALNSAWGLMSPYTPWHLYLLTHSVSHHPKLRRLTLSRVSLAWWFRLHPVPDLKILVLAGCEVDETGIGLVARACPGLLGLVVRGCEVRGGGWDVEGLRRPAMGTSHFVSRSGPIVGASTFAHQSDPEVVRGWWGDVEVSNGAAEDPEPPGPQRSNSASGSSTAVTNCFPALRIVRFELCPAACGLDSVRMVLDRSPSVERVEFVGCGPEETEFFHSLASSTGSSAAVDSGLAQGPLRQGWWMAGREDVESDVRRVVSEGRRSSLAEAVSASAAFAPDVPSTSAVDEHNHPNPTKSYNPSDRCIVVQGDTLRGFRSRWYSHLYARQRGLWDGHP